MLLPVILSVLLTLLLMIPLVMVFQLLATKMDTRTPATGQFVSVNGRRLYLRYMGDVHPGPVVILEAALGFTSSQWDWVQPALASCMPVVAYDRAGLGWSERGPQPRDARSIAIELHTALDRANVRGPFVMVGHSLGGLFVRVFADMFSDQVIGMVLVDATHPDQWTRLTNADGMRRMLTTFAILGHWCARLSVFRIVDGSRFLGAATLPTGGRLDLRAALSRTQHWEAARAEVAAWKTHTIPQVHESRWKALRPISVISAGETLKRIRGAEMLQDELAKLSSCGTRQVVEGATHMSIVTNQEFSRAVVQAIREIAHTRVIPSKAN